MTQSETPQSATELDESDTVSFGALPVDEEEPPPPVQLRRRKLPIATLVLAVAAAGGIGFFAGVRVEKAQITPTASNGSATSLSASAGSTGGGAASRGRGGAATQGGAGQGAVGQGSAGQGGASTANGGTNVAGTIALVQNGTLYITQSDGNTVKITTSDGTTVTRTVDGKVGDLSPGETVIVRGVQNGDGSYAAQSVTQANPIGGGFGGRGSGGFGGRNAQPSPSAPTAARG